MRKLGFFVIVGLLLLACSIPNLLPGSVDTLPTPTSSVTATRTSTATSTATPTPRNTPTDIGYVLTQTALVPIKPLPGVRTATPRPTATPLIWPTPSFQGEGFESVIVSEQKLFWGICKPHSATMTVKVLHPEEVRTVYLFFRLMSTKKDDSTEWVGTVTDNHHNGTFTYWLRANIIPHRQYYTKAWFQFQFVAEDKNEIVVGRSPIYEHSLTIQPCP